MSVAVRFTVPVTLLVIVIVKEDTLALLVPTLTLTTSPLQLKYPAKLVVFLALLEVSRIGKL